MRASILHSCWFLIFLGAMTGCAAPESTGRRSTLEALIEQHADDRVQVSVLARSLHSGSTLYSRLPRNLVRPASTMKLVTTIAVLLRRPDLEPVTRFSVSANGKVLRIIGGGDPMLSQEDLVRIASELRTSGVQGLRQILYEDPMRGRPRFGQGWMWDDEPGAFMPHLSGLTVDAATVTAVARRDADGLRIAVSPHSHHTPVVRVKNDGPLRISRDWRQGKAAIRVTGTLPVGQTVRRTLSVPDPARHVAEVMKTVVQSAGLGTDIHVEPWSARPWKTSVERVVRRDLDALLARANKPSDNLTAELLLRHLGGSTERPLGTAADGHLVVEDVLRELRISADEYRLADGSGVSHYNLISADLLVRLLTEAWTRGGPTRARLLESLSVAGKDGTLAHRLTGTVAAGDVHAKTGTMSAVSSIAGYANIGSEPFAFAIMIQNFTGSAKPWRDLQDRLLLELIVPD